MRFPTKTASAFATCVVTLAVFHRWNPNKGLTGSAFEEAWNLANLKNLPSNSQPSSAALPVTTASVATPSTSKTASENPARPLAGFLYDSTGALDPFFAALAKLDAANGFDQVTI